MLFNFFPYSYSFADTRRGKDIKFDAIDIFWGIEHGIKNYLIQNQPYQFLEYLEQPRFENWTIMQKINFPITYLGLSDYVNFITCDERYAHRLYDDNSLDFVWLVLLLLFIAMSWGCR